ncbi:MAG: aspartate aminotransferase family protein [Pseudomonadales bacterium]|nr:aspartate aminotransferase family protein [Pseudomonadales bacterium]NRA17389.1 aspartate aminotransferase family protein [Oceanospirillaceae bacterium]
MSAVFQRNCNAKMPIAVKGDGVYIIDENGKRYLDGCGGAAVSSLGHSHPRVKAAIIEQLDKIPFAHTGFFSSEPAEHLAQFLIDKAPGNMGKIYFTSGGSEAVEAALKLARQYFLERDQPERQFFISREQSYHGNTLGALGVGGNAWRREPFAVLIKDANYISPCYAYRGQQQGESEFDYGQRVASELEAKLEQLGANTVLAFIAEPVVGATLGAVPSVPGYFKRVREICDSAGILLILDEVMCGMGRTGSLFAYEQEAIVPDMVTMAKGLGAGYQPIGALMVSSEIHNTVAAGSGFFQHGHTYIGHATACAASLAVQQVIEEDQLLSNVKTQGRYLKQQLQERFAQHPHVGDIRGRGLFLGLELVADRADKSPLPLESQIQHKIKAQLMENGLMCYPGAGSVDGRRGHHILLAPPFIVEQQHLDFLVETLAKSIDQVLIGI